MNDNNGTTNPAPDLTKIVQGGVIVPDDTAAVIQKDVTWFKIHWPTIRNLVSLILGSGAVVAASNNYPVVAFIFAAAWGISHFLDTAYTFIARNDGPMPKLPDMDPKNLPSQGAGGGMQGGHVETGVLVALWLGSAALLAGCSTALFKSDEHQILVDGRAVGRLIVQDGQQVIQLGIDGLAMYRTNEAFRSSVDKDIAAAALIVAK